MNKLKLNLISGDPVYTFFCIAPQRLFISFTNHIACVIYSYTNMGSGPLNYFTNVTIDPFQRQIDT